MSSNEIPTMALLILTFLFFFFLNKSSVLIFLLALLQAVVQVILYALTFLKYIYLHFLVIKSEVLPSLATNLDPLPGYTLNSLKLQVSVLITIYTRN